MAHLIAGYTYDRFDDECANLPSHIIDLVFSTVGGLMIAYQQEIVSRCELRVSV